MTKLLIAHQRLNNPQSLAQRRVEQTDAGRARYMSFRTLVEEQMVRYWSSTFDLTTKLTSSLVDLIRKTPAIGWTRALSISTERLHSINETIEHARQTIQHWDSKMPLTVLHFGLDFSIAGDYVTEIIRSTKSMNVDYRILIMTPSVESLSTDAPAEVCDWTTYVPASVRRVMRHVRNFVAHQEMSDQTLKVQIRHYTRTPLFHGFTLLGASEISYFSICHFTPPDFDSFEWGEFSYRIIDNSSTQSDQHIATVAKGQFFDLWNHASELRWNFLSRGHNCIADDEFEFTLQRKSRENESG